MVYSLPCTSKYTVSLTAVDDPLYVMHCIVELFSSWDAGIVNV